MKKVTVILAALVLILSVCTGCKKAPESKTLLVKTAKETDFIVELPEYEFTCNLDVKQFKPVTKEQFACLPGCYVTADVDIPLYPAQNTNAQSIGYLSGQMLAYVKECGIHPEGSQWIYIVDPGANQEGWIQVNPEEKVLKSNYEADTVVDSCYVYSRVNSHVAIKHNNNVTPVPFTSAEPLEFTRDSQRAYTWNESTGTFSVYDVADDFEETAITPAALKITESRISVPEAGSDDVAAFNQQGTTLYFSRENMVCSCEVGTDQVTYVFSCPDYMNGQITQIYVSPSERYIIVVVDDGERLFMYARDLENKQGRDITEEIEYMIENFYDVSYVEFSNFMFSDDSLSCSFVIQPDSSFNEYYHSETVLLCSVYCTALFETDVVEITRLPELEAYRYLDDDGMFMAGNSLFFLNEEGDILKKGRYILEPDYPGLSVKSVVNPSGTILARALYSENEAGTLSHACRISFYSTDTLNLLYMMDLDLEDRTFSDLWWTDTQLIIGSYREDQSYLESYGLEIREALSQTDDSEYLIDNDQIYLCCYGYVVEEDASSNIQKKLYFEPDGMYALVSTDDQTGAYIGADIGAYYRDGDQVVVYKPEYFIKPGDASLYPPDSDYSGMYVIEWDGTLESSADTFETDYDDSQLFIGRHGEMRDLNAHYYAYGYGWYDYHDYDNDGYYDDYYGYYDDDYGYYDGYYEDGGYGYYDDDMLPVSYYDGIRELITYENVYLRDGPGTDYDIVVMIPQYTWVDLVVIGPAARIDGLGDYWLQVMYTDSDGMEYYGWCFGGYLLKDER